MAPENTKTDSEKAVEERDLRRKKVIQALRTSHSEMRDDKFRAKELALSTQNALDTLWDKGLNDPSRTSGSNFVEWWIDRDLWARMRGGRFPYPRPEQFGSPGSSKLVDYQRERLAKLATEKAAAEKAAAEKAAAEKTAAEKTAAEKAANDTAAKEAADKARGAQSGSAPPALAPTSKFDLHLPIWEERRLSRRRGANTASSAPSAPEAVSSPGQPTQEKA